MTPSLVKYRDGRGGLTSNLRRRTGEALSEPIYLAGAELLGRHPGVNKLFHSQRTSEQRTLL